MSAGLFDNNDTIKLFAYKRYIYIYICVCVCVCVCIKEVYGSY